MPGIAGIIGQGPSDIRAESLRSMLATMRHEPFYESGQLAASELGVWVGWMAHPGSFASRVSNYRHPDGSAVIFSGECFASIGGGDTLLPAEEGHFAAGLIEGCRAEGWRFLRHINGLFSGLLIDRSTRQCLLFNDRFGVERIYVHESDDALLFASEAKALLRIKAELRALEPRAVAQYLKFGSVLENRTLFRGINTTPGASAWSVESQGAATKARYFLPAEWESQAQLAEGEFQEAFSGVMAGAVPSYVGGDQAIGISITGGLDTRMIMASLPRNAGRAVCYTYAGIEGETLDARLGAVVADACGYPHHVLRIAPDFLRDYPAHLDRTVYVTDGCAGPLEAHEIYLTNLAARLARIRVTGNYGSEILRGMSTLKVRRLRPELMAPSFQPFATSMPCEATSPHPITRAAFEEIPWHLYGTLSAAKSALVVRTPYLDNELVRLAYQAPDVARRSPAAAFWMIRDRSPTLASIPTDQGRVPSERPSLRGLVMRVNASATFKLDYWHKEGLPTMLRSCEPILGFLAGRGLLGQHKYLPYRAWFRDELRQYLLDVLTDPQTARGSYWSADGLRRIASDHTSGRRNCLAEIHAILALESLDRVLIRQRSSTQPDRAPAGA